MGMDNRERPTKGSRLLDPYETVLLNAYITLAKQHRVRRVNQYEPLPLVTRACRRSSNAADARELSELLNTICREYENGD